MLKSILAIVMILIAHLAFADASLPSLTTLTNKENWQLDKPIILIWTKSTSKITKYVLHVNNTLNNPVLRSDTVIFQCNDKKVRLAAGETSQVCEFTNDTHMSVGLQISDFHHGSAGMLKRVG